MRLRARLGSDLGAAHKANDAQPEPWSPHTLVRGTVLSLHMRECSDAGAARRLLRLTPCWRHGGDVSACRRLDGGCIAQRARPVLLHSFVRCSSMAPTVMCKCRSSSSNVLFSLARQLQVVRSIVSVSVVSVSDSFMQLCGCATPLHGRCGTAAELTTGDPNLVQLASS